jgi:hypothetical protein
LNTSLEFNSSHVSRAVNAFIDSKVHELAERKTYDGELQKDVRDYLYEKADGTFLWVALVCKELEDVWIGSTRDVLKEFPTELNALYKRMVRHIMDERNGRVALFCRRILSSVALTYRPIHLNELVTAADLPEAVSDNLKALEELVSRCGSLLIVRNETVYFIHQSAKDYLTTGADRIIFPEGQTEEHCKIARRCLTLMSKSLKKDICCLEMPGSLVSEVECERVDAYLARHIEYACCYWVDHLREANDLQQNQSQVYKFLKEHFLHWLEALSLLRKMSEGVRMVAELQRMAMVSRCLMS